MMKPIDIKRCLVLGACLLAAATMGCEKEPQAPPKSNVVVKKIAIAKKAKAVKPAAQKAPKSAGKPSASKPAKTVAPVLTPSAPTKTAKSAPTLSAEAKTPAAKEPAKAAAPTPLAPDNNASAASAKKPAGIGDLAMLSKARIYNPEGRVNPFTPLFQKKEDVEEETEKKPKGRQRQPRIAQTPLEKVDLAQLKLVAIMQMQSGPRALVEESTGKGYVVRKGTYMGLHSGQVIAIEGDHVVVEEEVQNLLGDFEIKKRELKLQKPLGE